MHAVDGVANISLSISICTPESPELSLGPRTHPRYVVVSTTQQHYVRRCANGSDFTNSRTRRRDQQLDGLSVHDRPGSGWEDEDSRFFSAGWMEGANASGWPDSWLDTTSNVAEASPDWRPAAQTATASGWSSEDFDYGTARWGDEPDDPPLSLLDENGLLPLVEGPNPFASFSLDVPHPLSAQEIEHEVAADPQQFFDYALFTNGCARRRAARGLPPARCSIAAPCRHCLRHPNAQSRLAYRNISSLYDVYGIYSRSQEREVARQEAEDERNRSGPSGSAPVAHPHPTRSRSRSRSPRSHTPVPAE